MWQVTLTVLGTVISGVIVFVLCQLIVQKYVKPYEEFKMLRSRVAFLLVMYADLYVNPIDARTEPDEDRIKRRRQAKEETRKMAAEVGAFQERVEKKMPGIPSKDNLLSAASKLMELSHSYFIIPGMSIYDASKINRCCANEIKSALSISIDIKKI